MFQELMPDYNEVLSFWPKYTVADDYIIYIAFYYFIHESQGIYAPIQESSSKHSTWIKTFAWTLTQMVCIGETAPKDL